jgi:hypothetical protein
MPARDRLEESASNLREPQNSSSGNDSMKLTRSSSASSTINLALSDNEEDSTEKSSESQAESVRHTAPKKKGFLPVTDKMRLGKIVAIKETFGFIKRIQEEDQTFQRDLYFSLTFCQSGLLSLMQGDDVSFFVCEKKTRSNFMHTTYDW